MRKTHEFILGTGPESDKVLNRVDWKCMVHPPNNKSKMSTLMTSSLPNSLKRTIGLHSMTVSVFNFTKKTKFLINK